MTKFLVIVFLHFQTRLCGQRQVWAWSPLLWPEDEFVFCAQHRGFQDGALLCRLHLGGRGPMGWRGVRGRLLLLHLRIFLHCCALHAPAHAVSPPQRQWSLCLSLRVHHSHRNRQHSPQEKQLVAATLLVII